MPPWASTAFASGPWATVAIVAITVGGRLLGQILDILKIALIRSAKPDEFIHHSKHGYWVWRCQPGTGSRAKVDPPFKPQLRSVDDPGEDGEPAARSG